MKNNGKVNIKIDGKPFTVNAGSTVLQASKEAGIYIPTLCYLESVEAYGGCRLCIVDIKNMRGHPTACTTPISENMEITTNNPELKKLRQNILELLLSEHPYTCLICKDKVTCPEYMHTVRKASVATGCNYCTNNGDCELQDLIDYLEIKEIRFPITYRAVKPIKDNPFYDIDYNLCILCGRCVRVCNDVRNNGVLAFVQRGKSALVGTAFGVSQKEAGCAYCGACIDVCPTGTLAEKIGKWEGKQDKSTVTNCVFCSIACEMNINSKNDRIINVGPKQGDRTNPQQLCVRGKFTVNSLVNDPIRITKPMIKKKDKWIEVTYHEAIKYTAAKLERYKGNQFGIISSSHLPIEDNYVLQKFARTIMKTNNVDMLSSYSNKHLLKRINDFYETSESVDINDVSNADTILIIGATSYVTHPIVEMKIKDAYKKNKNIIIANSYNTKTSDFAQLDIRYNTDAEPIFLLSLLDKLFKDNTAKNKKLIGYKEIKETIDKIDLEKQTETAGINKSDLEALTSVITKSENLVIIVGDGILRHNESANNIDIMQNILYVCNKLNKKGSGVLFLLAEGDHFGNSLIGMHPNYLSDFSDISDSESIDKWSTNWSSSLSDVTGLSADEMMNNVAVDGITSLFIVGDIPPHKNIKDVQFIVQQNMYMTEISKYAEVIFPAVTFVESDGHFLNIERKLKELTPAITPEEWIYSSWELMTSFANDMVEKGFNYKNSKDIFTEINSFIDLAFSKKHDDIKELTQINFNLDSENKNDISNEYPININIEMNYFHYMGNIFTERIKDMKYIRDEGVLFISENIASEMGLSDSDSVKINTIYGQMQQKINIKSELYGNTAYFKPNWNHLQFLTNGLNVLNNNIKARIEKVN